MAWMYDGKLVKILRVWPAAKPLRAGMKGLTRNQPVEIPMPARTGYVLLPPELTDPDPVKAMEKQNAFAKVTKEKAAPTKA